MTVRESVSPRRSPQTPGPRRLRQSPWPRIEKRRPGRRRLRVSRPRPGPQPLDPLPALDFSPTGLLSSFPTLRRPERPPSAPTPSATLEAPGPLPARVGPEGAGPKTAAFPSPALEGGRPTFPTRFPARAGALSSAPR